MKISGEWKAKGLALDIELTESAVVPDDLVDIVDARSRHRRRVLRNQPHVPEGRWRRWS